MTTAATRDRILDSAENLFSDKGFAQTSLRAITAEAGVNLAAVNYHYGTKEALIEAVFHRVLDPLNRARLELLGQAEAKDDPPGLRAIVRAFVAPPLQHMIRHDRGPRVMKLFGRLYTEATPEVRHAVLQQFDEVFRRFFEALHRAAPHLETSAVVCRFHFMVGAAVHAMSNWHLLQEAAPHKSCATNPSTMLEQLVEFVAAGFDAPSVPSSPNDDARDDPVERDQLVEEK